MWFGTRNGLNRFDGNSFRVFRNNILDSFSIGSNSIVSLYEDKEEKLWVGTHKGIYIYDPLTETFTPFKKIAQTEISSLLGDDKNNIWIIADFILYKYNKRTNGLIRYQFEKEQTTAIRLSDKGTVWIGTNTGKIKKYNAIGDEFLAYDVIQSFTKKKMSHIQDVYPVTDTTLLVGVMDQVILFHTNNAKTENVFENYPWADHIKIHKIFQQATNEYWIGTETGLYILNLKTKNATHIEKQIDNPYSITDNVVYAFCRDTEGGTWIGTFFGGVNYYSRQYNKFQKYFPQTSTNSLKGNLIHEITSDKNGNLWIGTEDAGLNKIDGRTGFIKHFMAGKSRGDICYSNIHGLIAAGDELWIGTHEHGLDVMDLKAEKVVRHYNAGNDSNSLKSDFIVSLYETRNADILVGTWYGLFRYNRQKNNFSPLPFFNKQVQAIHEDKQGTLWVCSYGNGVYYYNAATGKKGNIRHEANNTNSLINNYVNNIFEDSKNNFWFCTEEGLSKYNPVSRQITNYSTQNGLSDNQIFRVLEDDAGFIWVSTARGLVQLNPLTGHTKKYSTANGLIADQFNYNSAYKKANTLFFGTVNGLISFNPNEFIKNSFVPRVYITGLQVNNKELTINGDNSPLNKSITYTSKIELPHDRSTISIDVAALSYAAPEMNEYAYKMEGLDKEWTAMKSNRKIFYTKLPPGDYKFKIKGSSIGEVWNEKETMLSIKILPPFWASIWAYVLYGLAAIGIIITIVRYYHIAMKEKSQRRLEIFKMEKEREIYNAKIEFFTNVTHEIRTPLTLIKMPLDKLMKKEINDPEIEGGLHMINKNTNRLIDLSNQLLDFRKAEANKYSLSFIKSNVSVLLREEYSNFKPAAEQKNLNFKLELPRIEPHAYLDVEAFKKILSNLINNAIKYAKTTVVVRLMPFGSEDDVLNIEFKNDGYLIPYELKEKIFEPFYRIKETEKQSGTGIGLPLSRSLAELHKGVLNLKKPEGKFNIFLLSLPIHQEKEIDLQDYESVEPEAPVAKEAEEAFDSSKPSVLIVEDNKEILGFLQRELSMSYKILQSLNGREALEVLQKENVQLIISDIMMPVMDGIELCKKIKTDLQYSHIPIILLTAKNTLHSKIEGLEVGADAYIEKPFSFEHLQAQITNLITNRNKLKEYFASSPLTHLKGIACSKPDKNFLEQLNNVIYENITDIELDVEQLSRLMNMSRPTLYRKIKALSNLMPSELIHLSRLKKAAELLAEGHKISEVASMVGYSVQSNFSRDFHKQFGITPTNYINNLQKI